MAKPTLPTVVLGSKEFVDFPELGISSVPAKVDTGADSSALWATDIVESDGVLKFRLFGKKSPYYTGKELSTRVFKVTSVKNSFGHTEYRYKVGLKVRLSGRLLQVRFTLANRENNSYPILIGRRTLHGKFLVDVSADATEKKVNRLLFLRTRITPSVSKFVKGVEEAFGPGLEITYTTYDNVQFTFDEAGPHITLISTGEDIASFDMMYFKATPDIMRDVPAAMAWYAQRRGVQVLDPATAHFPDDSKLYEYTLLVSDGIAVPPSLFMMPERLADSYQTFVERLGLPFVMKDIHASKGRESYLIKDEAEYDKVAARAAQNDLYLIGQTFVPNEGDYRVLVLGRRIELVIYRWRQDDTTHLNNTSRGGLHRQVKLSDLPRQVQIDSLMAAQIMELGVAGVDMVQDLRTGKWYCLEVNIAPQIASGALKLEKQQAFAQFIKTELKR